MRHLCVVRCGGCLRQTGSSSVDSGAVSVCVGAAVLTRIRSFPDAAGAAGAGDAGASGCTGAGAAGCSCCRINSLTGLEISVPQVWQTNCTGCCAISGVTSKEYFAPQEHWTFIG